MDSYTFFLSLCLGIAAILFVNEFVIDKIKKKKNKKSSYYGF